MMKVKPVTLGTTKRESFSRIDEVIDMPNLIEVQKNSYQWFLDQGLKEVFRDVATIEDFTGNLALEFIDYRLGEPKYTIKECKERDATYAAPLRVTARLLNKETGEVKEQEIFMGDFPLMTDAGTFVNNGAERVIVSQLVRSPGVYFGESYDKTGKKLYTATMNPNRGAWLEYETDSNDVFYVRIDKNRKLPVTVLIRALGLGSDVQIREFFGENEKILATLEKDTTTNVEEGLLETYRKLRPGEPPTVESAQTHLNNLFFDPRRYDLSRFGRYKMNKKLALARRIMGFVAARDIVAPLTGELLAAAGEKITREAAEAAEAAGVSVVYLAFDERELKVVTNGTVEAAPFFGFDVEECGINEKVNFAEMQAVLEAAGGDEAAQRELLEKNHDKLISKTVTIDDIFASINYLTGLDYGVGVTDDIDHLGNRRIRSVGELLQNQFRIGFSRMERVIRERMTLQAQDAGEATPQSLINIRPVVAAIKEFFGSSPLSQFMDQNNPLAELTHKRRLSALGPGGLSRDRAGFEVRDVHYSHYGRMCPIETPEGPNIGLISYLATFAKINEYGFVEAPYRKVDKEKGVVTDEVVYMTADVEDEYVVAQANEPLDAEGHFMKARVNARRRDEILEIEREKVDYMDVSPKMVVSVATAMIPFLENDDANRALMGSNMQRQAVPLMVTQQPIVATGMEYKAACDSGVCILAKNDGTVERVDADKIVVRTGKTTTDEYELIKFMRSNQGTCINQRPIVNKGDEVKKGQVIADGPSTKNGEISLGKNALIGFMTWEGYNYEDAVLINEKIVREDVYTSIHIEEYEIEARETKLGPEEITRDIPNVGEDALKDLDERGIIRIGAEVGAGDILVGKVTPKGETELTAEERLLRAIFGEKAREVRDTSLRVPHGEYGIIVDVKVFTPDNCDELQPGVRQVVRCYIAQKRKISVGDKMAGRHGNKGVVSRILPQEDMPFLADGTPLDIVLNPLGVPSRMNIGQVLEVHLGYAAKALGWKVMTPVFDGAHEEDIRECFSLAQKENSGEAAKPYPTKLNKIMSPTAGHVIDFSQIELDEDGKSTVYDGRTGEPFDNRITVGYMYYLKLHHLVDDKIHARSTGPYSLVTQQPLGGKAQFGGQRFGEMEVWALEAYGAAYTLQEILTVKSDDVVGRVKTYEAIVKGQPVPKPGIPESFRVLIKELQSLGLDVKVQDSNGDEVDLKQNFDDEEPGFDMRDLPMGEDVLMENELSDDYSIEEAAGDPDADAGFDEPDEVFEPEEILAEEAALDEEF
ncbi:DNA-directed RNA polymerase subunit beta [Oscillospiraceae bacterium]|uniref:DNA-directed RNA polymerase subunit beta n=1 Tax=Allofournierella sp. TaxID=1940256 RepID=UPI0015AE6BFA|nr:DNA-directed RNA polymerase subunit beta [Oscillospiraceae bacterium]